MSYVNVENPPGSQGKYRDFANLDFNLLGVVAGDHDTRMCLLHPEAG